MSGRVRERYWRDPTTLRNSLAFMEADPSVRVRLEVVESGVVASFAPAMLVQTSRSYIYIYIFVLRQDEASGGGQYFNPKEVVERTHIFDRKTRGQCSNKRR
jgi:hypothetical protein